MIDILRHPIDSYRSLRAAIRETIALMSSGYHLAKVVEMMMDGDKIPDVGNLPFPMPGHYTITAERNGRISPVAYHANQTDAELFAVGISMALRKKIAIAVVDEHGIQTYRYPKARAKPTDRIHKWT